MTTIKVSSWNAAKNFPETQALFYVPFLDEVKSSGFVIAKFFKDWIRVNVEYKQSSIMINGVNHRIYWDRYDF